MLTLLFESLFNISDIFMLYLFEIGQSCMLSWWVVVLTSTS